MLTQSKNSAPPPSVPNPARAKSHPRRTLSLSSRRWQECVPYTSLAFPDIYYMRVIMNGGCNQWVLTVMCDGRNSRPATRRRRSAILRLRRGIWRCWLVGRRIRRIRRSRFTSNVYVYKRVWCGYMIPRARTWYKLNQTEIYLFYPSRYCTCCMYNGLVPCNNQM